MIKKITYDNIYSIGFELRKDLSKDFDAMIKKAEDEGVFDEDIKKTKEFLKKLIEELS